ncbi:TY-Chap2 family putative peptide chaperone [Microbacterium sp.]|uniref:TY-Chap2 family putative peptide chaperone n=1 Tax=Microbacterium sp. TaxID=51671 RepID=UPI0028119AF3|nr:hypothetical protein [Microbacterium sp.]
MSGAVLILVHRVRSTVKGRLEPVGVWAIGDGDDEAHYYPPESQAFEQRGMKAMYDRPPMPLRTWAEYKASTSPNWLVLHDDRLGFGPPDLVEIHAQVRAQHEVTIGTPAAQQGGLRGASGENGVSGWDVPPAVLARSWWLAAEVVRRHPELIIYEMHPGGGQYDILCVAAPAQLSPAATSSAGRILLNRAGSIQVEGVPGFAAGWEHVLLDADPFHRVLQLESMAGLVPPARTPKATSRSLSYRLLATATTLFAHDRRGWDVRSEFVDTSGEEPFRAERIMRFPSAVADLTTTPRLGIYGEPHSHFWALMRGEEPIAIVSMEGRLYPRQGAVVDLETAYAKSGRRMRRVVATLLKKWF